MIHKIIKKWIGTRNDRILRTYRKLVDKINAFEPAISSLSDEALRAKTQEFKARLAEGVDLNGLLPEAFAVVREASRRSLGLRHFDVQLLGGITLHFGKIAEMRTGEGKTLVATLPAYLNALTGRGVHIVTVNDYLAKRDAAWMQPVYEFLGLSVGVNIPGLDPSAKQAAYAADITYGTNNEFGFDYLRDNMVFNLDQRVQRDLHYAVIDEVDSILIDEARTPLIISGQAEESSELYQRVNRFIPSLTRQLMEEGQRDEEVPEDKRGDYSLDEKNRQAFLTEQGHQVIEQRLVAEGLMKAGESLYDISNISLMHYVNAALRAHTLYQRDVHYIVKDNEVMIVDEHTGRLMPGRRWSEGLHQAVEAKEGVPIQLENQTLATITFQNYFRLYEKLSGMTGTADTEAFELQKIYGLEVIVLPTNKPMIRHDAPDRVYLTTNGKYQAILAEIKERHAKQQPILVGTASIEASELLSNFLTREKIPHQVLNAKQHAREAKIIAQAGKPGAVTIATNMAGRGTDIVLGGNVSEEIAELSHPSDDDIALLKSTWQAAHDTVIAAGGLHVLGTERNEARRIDNQLRGRAGRQGDPGSSQFYLSLEDNLLRIFASDRMANLMRRLGVTENDVIESKMVSRAIENAQRRVEAYNFDIRKNLLEYDDVANDQRKVVYQQRLELLKADQITQSIIELREEALTDLIEQHIPPESLVDQWDIDGLMRQLAEDFGLSLPLTAWLEADEQLDEEGLRARIIDALVDTYAAKRQRYGEATMNDVEKMILLQMLDNHWKEHLLQMDHLRQGIHLRGYAAKNPAQEFKRESFELFKTMLARIKYETISTLSRIEIADPEHVEETRPAPTQVRFHHDTVNAVVNRNDACPCGSGKKYKQCHGALS